eukprot:snap_masked-scaffold_18-processed-gene-1.21-mRNA-1 protein AED:0.06 eAED:0.07 QI:0/-1/0/1/-1/1/1/0/355
MKKIRVVSYNLLSPALCSQEKFIKSTPSSLKNSNRLKKILAKLNKEIISHHDSKPIFALQECSLDWASKLHKFFLDNEYTFVHNNYGHKFNGYMGVAIATPKSYKIHEIRQKRISETVEEPEQGQEIINTEVSTSIKEKIQYSILPFIFNLIILFLGRLNINYKFSVLREESDYQMATRRFNIATSLLLSEASNENPSFWISTYHMPCLFKRPNVMRLHLEGLANYVEELSRKKKVPHILLGDFNMQPDSELYKDFTRDDFVSAYKVFAGKEPEVTNYAVSVFKAKRKDEEDEVNEFIGTLDYIFLSPFGGKRFEVEDCVSLPSIIEVQEQAASFPSDKEPSDHLLIGCTLTLLN